LGAPLTVPAGKVAFTARETGEKLQALLAAVGLEA